MSLFESTAFLTATSVDGGGGRGEESAGGDSSDVGSGGGEGAVAAAAAAARPTRITEALLRSAARLPAGAPLGALRSLDLHVHGGTGRGPIVTVEALDACVGLTALNLSFNAIGALGRGLDRLTSLVELNLAENRLRCAPTCIKIVHVITSG